MGGNDVPVNARKKFPLSVFSYPTDSEFSWSNLAIVMTQNTGNPLIIEGNVKHGFFDHGLTLFFINFNKISLRVFDKVYKSSCAFQLQNRNSVALQFAHE